MSLPIFTPHIVLNPDDKKAKPELFFACSACLLVESVDATSGYCRRCWRLGVFLVAALREATGKL